MLISPPPLLLLAAALTALGALVLPSQSLQLKPTPPTHPPKPLSPSSSGSSAAAVRPVSNRSGRQQSSSPLSAYTVADNKNHNPWSSSINFPPAFAGIAAQFGYGAEDSLFSYEGGGFTGAPTKPYMPNLELEIATFTRPKDTSVEKVDLFSELNALTESFDVLQSSSDYKHQLYSETIKRYEDKVERLEEKNASLEKGLKSLTVNLERQERQLQEYQLEQEEENNAKEAIDNAKNLEEGNEMLRLRVRALEVELSDIAFASRHKATPAPPATVKHIVISQESAYSSAEAVVANANNVKVSPKAPSSPVPDHIRQRHQAEQLQLQVREYERERASVRKLLGLGIRGGINMVGKALNLWSPVYNLMLWGELRGHGNLAV